MTRTILHGGRVLDPAAGLDGAFDVVVEDGRIAAIAGPVDVAPAADDHRVDVTGLLVLPGLVDLHGHWYDGSPYGLDPVANLRGGVTTAVDAGTAGFSNFGSFRRHTIETAPVRVLAFVHVAAAGLVTTVVGELQDIRYARPREAAAIALEHRDVVVGIKVRLGSEACGDERGRRARRRAGGGRPCRRPPDGPHRRGCRRPDRPPPAAAGRHRDPCVHGLRPGHPRRRRPGAAGGACRRGSRRPVRHRPWLRQLRLVDRGAGAGRGAPARRDQHGSPSLFDRAPGGRPADHDVALPRPGHAAGGGRHRDDRGSGRDPRPARAGHAACRWSGRHHRPRGWTPPRSTCPMPRACAGR